jgi:hypothetical protein
MDDGEKSGLVTRASRRGEGIQSSGRQKVNSSVQFSNKQDFQRVYIWSLMFREQSSGFLMTIILNRGPFFE